jgi:hypothetical protein
VEAGPIAIRVGDLVIGVRTNDDEMSALLLGALRPLHQPHLDAPPNLSLTFGATDGRVSNLHLLYRSGQSVVRTRSRGRILRGALRHLEGFAPTPPDRTGMNAKLLVRDGDATLVDGRFGATLDVLERRLHRLGFRVVDVHTPLLDRDTLEITLGAPRLEIDSVGRAEIDRRYPPTSQEVELEDRRYRLARIVAWGEEAPDGRSPARRFAELTPLVAGRDGRIAPGDLEVLTRLPRSCQIRRIEYPDAHQLLAALRDVTARTSR